MFIKVCCGIAYTVLVATALANDSPHTDRNYSAVRFETFEGSTPHIKQVVDVGSVQCAILSHSLPKGVIPWAGLETQSVYDGKDILWIAVHPGLPCGEYQYQVLVKKH